MCKLPLKFEQLIRLCEALFPHLILMTTLRSEVGLPPLVHRYIWIGQRLQGPTGLQGVTASITAPPTFGPARTHGQGRPKAASFSGLYFIDYKTEAQRVTISLYGASVQIIKMKKQSSTLSL